MSNKGSTAIHFPFLNEADSARNNASWETGAFSGRNLDSQTTEGKKCYPPLYALVPGTKQTFGTGLLKATPGNPKACAATGADNVRSWRSEWTPSAPNTQEAKDFTGDVEDVLRQKWGGSEIYSLPQSVYFMAQVK